MGSALPVVSSRSCGDNSATFSAEVSPGSKEEQEKGCGGHSSCLRPGGMQGMGWGKSQHSLSLPCPWSWAAPPAGNGHPWPDVWDTTNLSHHLVFPRDDTARQSHSKQGHKSLALPLTKLSFISVAKPGLLTAQKCLAGSPCLLKLLGMLGLLSWQFSWEYPPRCSLPRGGENEQVWGRKGATGSGAFRV